MNDMSRGGTGPRQRARVRWADGIQAGCRAIFETLCDSDLQTVVKLANGHSHHHARAGGGLGRTLGPLDSRLRGNDGREAGGRGKDGWVGVAAGSVARKLLYRIPAYEPLT